MSKPYIPDDSWAKRARKEGYRARSVYKLMELDERFRLFKPGMTVLDLGAAPGSWLQYAAKRIGEGGKAIGIDLEHIAPIAPRVRTYREDATNLDAIDAILAQEDVEKVDLVLSDLAPSTSGIKDVDQWRSLELDRAALAVARRHLKPSGRCVLKVLRGADFDEFLREVKEEWKDVHLVSPKASRDRSREVYVVLTGKQEK